MPKTKSLDVKQKKKETPVKEIVTRVAVKKPEVDEEEKEIDPELIIGEEVAAEILETEEEELDDEDVNPFHDKWEE